MDSIVRGAKILVSRVHHRIVAGNGADVSGSSFGSAVNLTNDCATPSRTTSTGYTELMGGSVPCPSCKGSGRIPKGKIYACRVT